MAPGTGQCQVVARIYISMVYDGVPGDDGADGARGSPGGRRRPDVGLRRTDGSPLVRGVLRGYSAVFQSVYAAGHEPARPHFLDRSLPYIASARAFRLAPASPTDESCRYGCIPGAASDRRSGWSCNSDHPIKIASELQEHSK